MSALIFLRVQSTPHHLAMTNVDEESWSEASVFRPIGHCRMAHKKEMAARTAIHRAQVGAPLFIAEANRIAT